MGKYKMHEIFNMIDQMFQGDKTPTGHEFMLLLKEIDPKVNLKIWNEDKGEFVDHWQQYVVKNIYVEKAVKYFKTKKHNIKKKSKSKRRSDYEDFKYHFIMCDNEEIKSISDKITLEEAKNLMFLLTCLTIKSDGMLVNDRGESLTTKEMEKILKISPSNRKRFLNKMGAIDLIQTKKDKNDLRKTIYFINKKFHSMKEAVKNSFTKIFKERLKEVVTDKRMGNAIGALYKIIPYIHYQTGYVCWNPDEDIREDSSKLLIDCLQDEYTIYKIDHIVQKQLANFVVGITEQTMNIYIGIFEELSIMKREVMGNVVLHIVDPSLILRQDYIEGDNDSSYLRTVDFQFSQLKRYSPNGARKKSNRGRKKKENK
jgi:DNA-binding MarR family transcriptional regulator